MTGIFVRIKRENTWVNLEIEHLTEKEINNFMLGKTQQELVQWIVALCRQINVCS